MMVLFCKTRADPAWHIMSSLVAPVHYTCVFTIQVKGWVDKEKHQVKDAA